MSTNVEAILDNLNPAQREAVQHGDGPLLIVAGAGSGKTRVITRRIAYLMEQGVEPWRILAITFTNKAAGEMKERVHQLVGDQGAWISTFHSMGARILRREAEALGFDPRFTIYDTGDRKALVKQVMSELSIDTSHYRPSQVASTIGDLKVRLVPPEEFAEQSLDYFNDAVARIYPAYQEALRNNNALDFDDLLARPIELFEKHPEILDQYRERFQYVLVDEYQDTNRVQYKIAKALSSHHGNLCVVGDADQSIYGWRGADIRNILDFTEDFPGAKIIKLEQNYRSCANILAAASAVIGYNGDRIERELWTDNEDGPLIREISAFNDREEAREIAARIRELMRQGMRANDIAIFYRTNAISRSLERSLRDNALPYTIVGSVEFYQRREVKDVLAYLRILANPADSISLRRILNVPSRGIGTKTLALLDAYSLEKGQPLLITVLDPIGVGLSSRALKAVMTFSELARELMEQDPRRVGPLVEGVIRRTEYESFLLQGGNAEEMARVENVRELIASAREYDADHPEDGSLAGFLEEVSLVADVDKWDEAADRVTLMTLHASKGLEFPYVFIAGVEEGLLPHMMSADTETGIEEERRLFYVGITRTMRELTVSWTKGRSHFGQTGSGMRSRFLNEIPAELLEQQSWPPPRPMRNGIPPAPEDDFDDLYDPLDDFGGGEEWKVGDLVEHEHFGRGRVQRVSGMGQNRRITIDFEIHGRKKLLIDYAALMRIEEYD
ncbi:MAG: UvrD-helicase domain-containing protein [Planctomycetota bacterium]